MVVSFDAEIRSGSTAELLVVVGNSANHTALEIEYHLFFACQFDRLQDQQGSCAGVLMLQAVAGNEVVHQSVVPYQESRSADISVGVLNAEDIALVVSFGFALQYKEELAGVGGAFVLLK